jgi:uncharacterized membrane protein YcaP (DUF421 family)
MDMLLRSVTIYLFLLIIFRVLGKRSLAQITTFDFVLLLIIGEAIQQGLLGKDFSVINAVISVMTLLILDIGFSILKHKFPQITPTLESCPVVIVEDGKVIREFADKELIDEEDILEAARELQGLERLDQIKYAILERSGSISIIPKS